MTKIDFFGFLVERLKAWYSARRPLADLYDKATSP